MIVEEIATRIRTGMKVKNVSLFELAAQLRWSPARLLRWIDGTLASEPTVDEDDGTLRDLVSIGQALNLRWIWTIGKAGWP
jgi:hypothetical protein